MNGKWKCKCGVMWGPMKTCPICVCNALWVAREALAALAAKDVATKKD